MDHEWVPIQVGAGGTTAAPVASFVAATGSCVRTPGLDKIIGMRARILRPTPAAVAIGVVGRAGMVGASDVF